uniref:Uncharacterized protein n=1 Tax=Elaeophora elaphi TaxID=1147741 RepID=A0A0R3RVC6_9BILA
MAGQVNNKIIEENTELPDQKSLNISKLQQSASGNSIPQTNEGTLEDLRNCEEVSIESQNVPENESNPMDYQLSFPFTDLAEATSMHIDSILGNRNAFQQENDFYSQQLLNAPDYKIPYGTGIQQQVPFQFENYANQIVRQKLMQSFIGTSSPAVEITDNQIADTFALPQTADNSDDQQAINDKIRGIPEPVKNFPPKLQFEKQANFEILHGNENLETNEAEINDSNMVNRNPENWNSEEQQLEAKCQVIPNIFSTENTEKNYSIGEISVVNNENIIPVSEKDFTTKTIFIGLQFIDGKLLNVVGGLSNGANDPQRVLDLPATRNQKFEGREIPDKTPGSSEKSQEALSDEFSEMVHSEKFLAAEIDNNELGYSLPEVATEIERSKEEDVDHPTVTDKTYHITEGASSVQDELKETSTDGKYLTNSDFIGSELEFVVKQNESSLPKEPVESLTSECNPENANQKIFSEIVPRTEFVSSDIEERFEQRLVNAKLVQNIEKPENVNKIQDEHQKSVENEKFHEQICFEKQIEKSTNAEINDNVKSPNELISNEKKENFESNNTLIESKLVSEEEGKFNFSSNISNCKYEMAVKEGDGNIAINTAATCGMESLGSSESANKRVEKKPTITTKSKQSLQNESKNIRDVANIKPFESTLKTTKKILPTTTNKLIVSTPRNTLVSTSKDTKKSSQLTVDKKLVTKSAVPLVPTKSANLMRKNIGETGLKHTKKITANSNSNAKIISKQNTLTKAPTVTSKLTQSAKSQPNNGAKIDVKNGSKDIIEVLKTDEKSLIAKEKKIIGLIDLKPLVWTEILVPTYEQIWKSYESTKSNVYKTNLEFEKTIEKEVEKELKIDKIIDNFENNNLESIWKMKKNSEMMEAEVINSINLSDRNEISVPEPPILCINNKREFIPDPSEKREEVIEEEVIMEDSSEKHEITISGSVSIKSSEATEMSLKVKSQIPSEQKTLDTTIGQNIGDGANNNSGNTSHGNIKEDKVADLKSNLPEKQHQAEMICNNGSGAMIEVGDLKKMKEMNGNEKELLSSEVEKSEMEHNCKELEETQKQAPLLDFKQEAEPEPEKNYNRRRDEVSRYKHYMRKSQFGGMYSDVPAECRQTAIGKDTSSRHQQIAGQLSDNLELKINSQQQSQQQSNGNQNHSRKQQRQQPDDGLNTGYNQNHSSQQGHRKRNKRNKKSRNW